MKAPSLQLFVCSATQFIVDFAETRKHFGSKSRHKLGVCDYDAEASEKSGKKGDLAKAGRTLLAHGSESSLRLLWKRYRDEAIADLTAALESPVSKYVFEAAWALGELGAVKAIPKLRRFVRE